MIESLSLLALSAISFKCLRAVYPYLRSPYIPAKDKYVIINGCTDGIGKQYAKYMNNNKIPLVLIGRNLGKLEALNKQLLAESKIQNNNIYQNKLVQIDYSDRNLTFQKFNQILEGLKLPNNSVAGIVNCCGVGYVQKYDDISYQQLINVKQVNTLPLQLCLKGLSKPYMQNQPFFINISSFSASYPLKYSAVYSASKAYVSNLISAYQKESKNTKILSVQPWYVSTKMIGYQNSWDCVKPKDVVEGSMRALKYSKRCTGSIKHELMYQFRYPLQKLYFPSRIQQNFERVKKVLQLRAKRSNKRNIEKKSE